MTQGIVLQGFVPLRREPSERSEMISQILFGESFDILEQSGGWAFIKLHFDAYEGWAGQSDIHELNTPNDPSLETRIVSSQVTSVIRKRTNQQVLLPAGAVAANFSDGSFRVNGETFKVEIGDHFIKAERSNDIEKIVRQFTSIPYLWGGRCGFGFDCSGLVQYLCRIKGIDLPRDSTEQAQLGENVNFIHEIMPGDLAFFDNAEGEINHVGFVLEGGCIVHSSGFVKIDRIDQQGIFNVERGKYTHRLRVIKRIAVGKHQKTNNK